jgi:hypothetical protein
MSINQISYLDQFYPNGIFTILDPEIYPLSFIDGLEIAEFINSLDGAKIYVASFEFIFL